MFKSIGQALYSMVFNKPITHIQKVWYKPGTIGTQSRIPRDEQRAKWAAYQKRERRAAKRLQHWTGVRG